MQVTNIEKCWWIFTVTTDITIHPVPREYFFYGTSFCRNSKLFTSVKSGDIKVESFHVLVKFFNIKVWFLFCEVLSKENSIFKDKKIAFECQTQAFWYRFLTVLSYWNLLYIEKKTIPRKRHSFSCLNFIILYKEPIFY